MNQEITEPAVFKRALRPLKEFIERTYERCMTAVVTATHEMGLNVTRHEIESDMRYIRVSMARQAITCAMVELHGIPHPEISAMMGRERTTVIYYHKQGLLMAKMDPVTGTLMRRVWSLLGNSAPEWACDKDPERIFDSKTAALAFLPGGVRVEKDVWRCPRPWMGETADSIRPFHFKPRWPSERKPQQPEDDSEGDSLPKDKKKMLDAWRKQPGWSA
jgi:hypothetical protein